MDFVYENNVIRSQSPNVDENLGGLGKILFNYMKSHGSRIAQVDPETENSDTFAELLKKCVRTAISLKDMGIKKGDFISLCSYNQLNACVPITAAMFLGAIPFSVEPSLTALDCSKLLEQVHPKIIFAQKCVEQMIKTSLNMAGYEANIVIFEENFEKDFLEAKINEDSFEPIHIKSLDETAMVYFSSGSTGVAKPVCLKHYCLVASCGDLTNDNTALFFYNKSASETYLSFSNWHWISSGWSLVSCTAAGACRIISSNFDGVKIWHYIDKYKVTTIFMSPLKIIELCESEQPKEADVSSLKLIIYGGSSLAPEYVYKLQDRFPNIICTQGYGQTEVGFITVFNNLQERRIRGMLRKYPTSTGRPAKGMAIKVVDPETDEPLGFNQPGEVRLKTRTIMNGYYGKDSSSSFDSEGFFKTGDIMYYNEDFCFFYVQRMKELLKYREWHVFPVVLENILQEHPAVKNAVVIGKPHTVDGDHPMAVVILKNNCYATEEELLKYVNDRVEDRQKIRGGIVFVNSFPLGATGKLNRLGLKKMVLSS